MRILMNLVLFLVYDRVKSHWIHHRSGHRRSPRAAGRGLPVQVLIDWFIRQVNYVMNFEQWEREHGYLLPSRSFATKSSFYSQLRGPRLSVST